MVRPARRVQAISSRGSTRPHHLIIIIPSSSHLQSSCISLTKASASGQNCQLPSLPSYLIFAQFRRSWAVTATVVRFVLGRTLGLWVDALAAAVVCQNLRQIPATFFFYFFFIKNKKRVILKIFIKYCANFRRAIF